MKFGKITLGQVLLVVVLLGLCGCAGTRPPVEGIWEKIVPAGEAGEAKAVKIVSEGHFAFGTQSADGSRNWSGGGLYEYDGENYTETVTYHWIGKLVGMAIEFNCTVENGKWFHQAVFDAKGEKFHIDEVWQRVE